MKKILLPRQGGKTSQLIEMADNYNGYIICPSVERIRNVLEQADRMGKKINPPITFRGFMRGQYCKGLRAKIFIDDLDDVLSCIFEIPIEAITMTIDE